MKTTLSVILATLIAILSTSTAAQSGRPQENDGGKANQRKQTPEPEKKPVQDPGLLKTPAADDEILSDDDVIRINTQLVSIPVRVMDKEGRFVAGLEKENFKVTENGTEQEIAIFSNEQQPFTVALVLDVSYSANFKIADIQSAAIAFIDQLRPHDKVMVVSFAEEIRIHSEPTSDRNEIYRAIRETKIATGTSLYEAVDLVVNEHFRGIDGRKAMILFTDGVDTTSRRANQSRNLNDVMELDALIYTVRYDTYSDVQNMNGGKIGNPPPISSPGPTSGRDPFPILIKTMGLPGGAGTTEEEYRKAGEYLDQLSQRTGGRLYTAENLGNLSRAYAQIASELREYYSIAYYPTVDHATGNRGNIKVKVDQTGLVVRARETILRRKLKKD